MARPPNTIEAVKDLREIDRLIEKTKRNLGGGLGQLPKPNGWRNFEMHVDAAVLAVTAIGLLGGWAFSEHIKKENRQNQQQQALT